MLSRRALLATSALLPWVGPAKAQPLDDVTSPGFQRSVLIRWGDRVEPASPNFTPDQPTPAAVAGQFGWDAVVLGVITPPLAEDKIPRAILAVSHPSADPRMMLPASLGLAASVLTALAQGGSILDLEWRLGQWLVIDGGYHSRRLTSDTACRITGPAAKLMASDARGVRASAAGCVTPWGSVLIAEAPLQGAADTGWLVEIDALDPNSLPAKRSLLGRFARAGVFATIAADGRAVIFMSDDRVRGHLFRFVSASPVNADTPDALDMGVLSVATLVDLSLHFVAMPEAGVLPMASLDAARRVGGALFDAPSGMAQLANGSMLLALRGGPGSTQRIDRVLGEGNPNGAVLMMRPRGEDATADVFDLELALSGGDAGMGQAEVDHPTALAVGGDGRIWIAAEGSGLAIATAGFASVSRAYQPPIGAVMGGVAVASNGHAISSVRHPGALADADFAHPATRWPSFDDKMPPQTTVIALGGRV